MRFTQFRLFFVAFALVVAASSQPAYAGHGKAKTPKPAKPTVDINGDGIADVPGASCNESRFSPTVCWYDVPSDVKYRPNYNSCGGKAAILMSGAFVNSFSAVLRDRENRDRYPPCKRSGSNYGNCSFYQCDTLGLNQCSAFKCQKTFYEGGGKTRTKVCCLGDKGTSSLLRGATRITVKATINPASLVRLSLKNNDPTQPLN